MRGEYISPTAKGNQVRELPPHARRILPRRVAVISTVGTTSACAENTISRVTLPTHLRNYLRMRGEYNDETLAGTSASELPPHARRIRNTLPCHHHKNGTTSACAENTKRQCGTPTPTCELPPHARRIPFLGDIVGESLRTTSACAENTYSLPSCILAIWNYLRMRGEYAWRVYPFQMKRELPPHARRILLR